MTLNNKIFEILQEVLYIFRTIVICSVAVFLCTNLIISPIYVEGSSMYPTLEDSDFGFSFILGSLISSYERFDVVVVLYEKTNSLWIKRIIGLPGETIEFDNDNLYINGELIIEDYLDSDYISKQTFGGTLNFTTNFGPIYLGEDEYFLMGDNRLVSQDSRVVGVFSSNDIISKYVYILYPFKNIGLISNS